MIDREPAATANNKRFEGQPKTLPDDVVVEKTGFHPNDLAKAPVKPPELKDARGPNRRQFYIIITGLLVVCAGIISWPLLGPWAAAVITVAGAITIMVGTLIRA